MDRRPINGRDTLGGTLCRRRGRRWCSRRRLVAEPSTSMRFGACLSAARHHVLATGFNSSTAFCRLSPLDLDFSSTWPPERPAGASSRSHELPIAEKPRPSRGGEDRCKRNPESRRSSCPERPSAGWTPKNWKVSAVARPLPPPSLSPAVTTVRRRISAARRSER